jgi:thiol-disulfide isomerase/thioredoxin
MLILLKSFWEFLSRLFGTKNLVKEETIQTIKEMKIINYITPKDIICLEPSQDFDEILTSYQYIVVKFTAKWCKPCQKLNPLWDQLARENTSIQFVTIDVDVHEQLAAEHGAIKLPYFITFKLGKKSQVLFSSDTDKIKDLVQSLI